MEKKNKEIKITKRSGDKRRTTRRFARVREESSAVICFVKDDEGGRSKDGLGNFNANSRGRKEWMAAGTSQGLCAPNAESLMILMKAGT